MQCILLQNSFVCLFLQLYYAQKGSSRESSNFAEIFNVFFFFEILCLNCQRSIYN